MPEVTAAAGLADPALYTEGVPHKQFAWLRRSAPVSWVREVDLVRRARDGSESVRRGSGFWAVTRHADVVRASRATDVFSSGAKGAFLPDPATPEQLARTRQLLVNMDAPDHTRLRRVMTAGVNPRVVRAVTEGIRVNAERLVAEVVAAGEFDVVADLAAELPVTVLADLLGMPRADRNLLVRWSNTLVGFDDPEYGGGDVDAYRRTFAESFEYATAMAAEKRRNPDDGMVSVLVNGAAGGQALTGPEFCQAWMLLIVAGNETTRHAISGGLAALAEHPEQTARLCADPDLVPTAVEEILRWVTPIMQFRRTAVADTELGGQLIAAGDKVVLYHVSANRDEDVFTDPFTFDVGRDPNQHLAFGIGPHFCLGATLARTELAILLRMLLPHLSRFEPAGPAVRLASNFVNGIKSMPARLRPAGPAAGACSR
jgi:cytochrome P450